MAYDLKHDVKWVINIVDLLFKLLIAQKFSEIYLSYLHLWKKWLKKCLEITVIII